MEYQSNVFYELDYQLSKITPATINDEHKQKVPSSCIISPPAMIRIFVSRLQILEIINVSLMFSMIICFFSPMLLPYGINFVSIIIHYLSVTRRLTLNAASVIVLCRVMVVVQYQYVAGRVQLQCRTGSCELARFGLLRLLGSDVARVDTSPYIVQTGQTAELVLTPHCPLNTLTPPPEL